MLSICRDKGLAHQNLWRSAPYVLTAKLGHGKGRFGQPVCISMCSSNKPINNSNTDDIGDRVRC